MGGLDWVKCWPHTRESWQSCSVLQVLLRLGWAPDGLHRFTEEVHSSGRLVGIPQINRGPQPPPRYVCVINMFLKILKLDERSTNNTCPFHENFFPVDKSSLQGFTGALKFRLLSAVFNSGGRAGASALMGVPRQHQNTARNPVS